MMPLRLVGRAARLLHTTAAAAVFSAAIAPVPAVAATDDAMVAALEKSLAEDRQFLVNLEWAMVAAPMRSARLARTAINERPHLAPQIQTLRRYVGKNVQSVLVTSYQPLYAPLPFGQMQVPTSGLSDVWHDRSVFLAASAIFAAGAFLMLKPGGEPDTPKGPDDGQGGAFAADDQGASKRARNGSAPGRATYDAERNNSSGVVRIGAPALYALGYTGRGIRVATIDTGADSRHHEIHHSLDEDLSYNFLERNHDIDDYNDHGTHVLGLIVGARDGYGMHGVAYEAESMSFNAITPADETGQTRNLDIKYVVRSYERALSGQADVINNSWGMGGNIEGWTLKTFKNYDFYEDLDAVTRGLVAADTVLVFASGNSQFDSPDLFAGLPLIMPDLQGHWVVAASVDSNNQLSWFSNKCGVAKDFCLVAPGEGLLSAKSLDGRPDDADEYLYMSGTSMAAPLVSGGVALLKQAFPELTSPEILDILFESATDLGEVGVDEVYGHGLMNLEAAALPIGALTLAGGDTTAGPRHGLDGSRLALGGGIGAAVAEALGGHSIMALDARHRGYTLPSASLVAIEDVPMVLNGLGDAGSDLSFGSVSLSITPEEASIFAQRHFQAAGIDQVAEIGVGAGNGVGFKLGLGQGERHAMAAYAGVEHKVGAARVSAEVGRVLEAGAVLGSVSSGAFSDAADQSTTDTLRFGATWLHGDTSLQFASSLGWTDFRQGEVELRGAGILTSAVAAGVSRQSLWSPGDEFALSISTPLAVSSGTIEMTAPVARVAATGEAVSTGIEQRTTRMSLEAQEQPVDLGVSYARSLGPARLKFDAGWRTTHDVAAATLGLYMEF